MPGEEAGELEFEAARLQLLRLKGLGVTHLEHHKKSWQLRFKKDSVKLQNNQDDELSRIHVK